MLGYTLIFSNKRHYIVYTVVLLHTGLPAAHATYGLTLTTCLFVFAGLVYTVTVSRIYRKGMYGITLREF
jgi:hypothetical protein